MNVDLESGEVRTPFLRTRYNYSMDLASLQSGISFLGEETRTKQQFKEECDINTIVRRFGITGELPTDVRAPLPSDFIDVVDYQSALNQLIAAESAFMQYPADIRARFQNDPGRFLDFINDPKNKEETKKWGLLRPETPPPAPISVRVIPDPSGDVKTSPEGSGAK